MSTILGLYLSLPAESQYELVGRVWALVAAAIWLGSERGRR